MSKASGCKRVHVLVIEQISDLSFTTTVYVPAVKPVCLDNVSSFVTKPDPPLD